MRIAFITYEFPPDTGKGGIGTYTKQVAEMLAANGWDVHVFCGTPALTSFAEINAVKIHKLHCANPQEFTVKLPEIFAPVHRQKNFDIAEAPEIHGNAAAVKNIFPQVPLLVRLHAPNWLVEQTKKNYIPFSKKMRFVLGALRRGKWDAGYWRKYDFASDPDYKYILLANRITAPSDAMKNWVVKNWQLKEDKIKVLPNIFEPARSFLQIPIEENTDTKTILFFGRLNVLKGLVNASYAINTILDKYNDWKFVVIGDDGPGPDGCGSMRQWMQTVLKKHHTKLQFENGVDYEQLPGYLQQAEIVLLPSLFESFSYTCLEAMAAGKAVIGSRGTGMDTIITHLKDGLLANPNSVSDITACIELLIQDTAKRKQIAKAARQTATTKFTAEKLLPQYKQLYKTTVAGE